MPKYLNHVVYITVVFTPTGVSLVHVIIGRFLLSLAECFSLRAVS